MKNVFITVDLEEWYELDYLKKFNLSDSETEVIPNIVDFLNLLDQYHVKATFFAVTATALQNAHIIREIVSRGHALGSHGFDHELLYNKRNDVFFYELQRSKATLEQIAGCKVEGYRASCFSMERDKLELVKLAGYTYDSSKIVFKQHPLYRNLDLTGFEAADDLVYVKGDFAEYEIPTLQLGKYSLPISGGGYLRLFPFWLLKLLIKQYEKQHHNFLIYLHPFELTDTPLPLPRDLSKSNKFRALVGRKNNLKKVRKLIGYLQKTGSEFRVMTGSDRVDMEMPEHEAADHLSVLLPRTVSD